LIAGRLWALLPIPLARSPLRVASTFPLGEKKDVYTKAVQRTVLCMGRKQEAVEDVPCGNTVALVGLDQVYIWRGSHQEA